MRVSQADRDVLTLGPLASHGLVDWIGRGCRT